MARAYTLANGSMLVAVDNNGLVRDIFYPRIGLENHVSGEKHRIGVYVGGAFSWLGDSDWDTTISCSEVTMAGRIIATNERLGVQLQMRDVVYNEKNIFLREVEVKNMRDEKREVKVFFAQVFRLWEASRGDTAFFDPRCNALIHYKGRRVFLVNAQMGKKPFSSYTTGLFHIEGKEGSYKDAEDGVLEENPIAHSSADSVLEISREIRGGKTHSFHYWIAAGRYMEEVHDLNSYVLEKTPEYLAATASDYWAAWIRREDISFGHLDPKVVEVFQKSLLITRAHVDDAGGIMASADSDMLNQGRDTYSYTWPRDAGFVVLALTSAGDFTAARRFFEFCNKVVTREGYFMHKYLPDGSVGSSWHPWIRDGKESLPIQEDETAIVLIALKHYYELSRNLEFIEEIYNSLIKRSADFLASFVDKKTGLPQQSYDLWEERYGVHTYTAASIFGALQSAALFSELLGKKSVAKRYAKSAEGIQKALLKYLYDEDRGVFHKSVSWKEGGSLQTDELIDMSSVFGVYAFGILPPDDERVKRSIACIERDLRLHEGTIGGVPRNQTDGYYRVSFDLPPNPWNIETLWLAQYYLLAAKKQEDLEPAKELMKWVADHAAPSGVLSEQLHPITGEHIGATPLAWSQAEFVSTVIMYLQKLDEFGVCKTCYPLKRS